MRVVSDVWTYTHGWNHCDNLAYIDVISDLLNESKEKVCHTVAVKPDPRNKDQV